jgi:hypothetical protein
MDAFVLEFIHGKGTAGAKSLKKQEPLVFEVSYVFRAPFSRNPWGTLPVKNNYTRQDQDKECKDYKWSNEPQWESAGEEPREQENYEAQAEENKEAGAEQLQCVFNSREAHKDSA